jgi:hypothetical protein
MREVKIILKWTTIGTIVGTVVLAVIFQLPASVCVREFFADDEFWTAFWFCSFAAFFGFAVGVARAATMRPFKKQQTDDDS